MKRDEKEESMVVGVSFHRASLQHLHIFKSGNEYRAPRHTKTSQWEGCVPAAGSEPAASIPAAPWERHREAVWEPRGPPSWAEGGEPLVAHSELAFHLCPFSSVISALPLQPQMANMAKGLAFVSKMIMMEVFFHPDRDISSHRATDIFMSEMLGENWIFKWFW